jgi:hypothetical protein
MEHQASGKGVTAIVRRNPSDGSVAINGQLTTLGSGAQTVRWIAAAPVTRGIGFAGSGMPYPNKDIAMEGTPHSGTFETSDGTFSIVLKDIPAGYYSGLGSIYIPPSIEFHAQSKADPKRRSVTTLTINATAAPYRWISGSPASMLPEQNTDNSTGRSMYYFGRETLPLFDNQESLLRHRAYPGDMTARGWPEAEDAKPWLSTPSPA